MARMTALRQSGLSNGLTSVLIAVHQVRSSAAWSAFALSVGLLTIFACVSLCTPVEEMSMSMVPLISWLSRSSALTLSLTSISSGNALRIGSLAGSQLGLRTSAKLLPTWNCFGSNMYGPLETIWPFLYFEPVSAFIGTGAVDGSWAK